MFLEAAAASGFKDLKRAAARAQDGSRGGTMNSLRESLNATTKSPSEPMAAG
jgi:hypothetical protein